MANRYGFFPVLPPDPNSQDFVKQGYRPSLADIEPRVPYNSATLYAPEGPPSLPFFFCIFPDVQMAQVIQLPNAYIFPNASPDHVLSAIGADINDPNDILYGMRQAITVRGLIDPVTSLQQSYRDVLFSVLQQMGGLYANLDLWSIN